MSEAGRAGEVRQAVAAMRLGGGRALASTEVWRQVTALVRGSALLGSKWCGLRCHYSDYAAAATDGLGLGIGSVSATETWVVGFPSTPAASRGGGGGSEGRELAQRATS